MLDDIALVIMDVVSDNARPLSLCNLLTSFANGVACANPELYGAIPYTSVVQASTATVTVAKSAYDQRNDNSNKRGIKAATIMTAIQHVIGFGCGYLAGYAIR
jgi:hypothetical protein